MAYGCADRPAAVSAFDVRKTAGFYRVPLVDATGGFTGNVTAAEAGEDFVDRVHGPG